MRLVIYTKTGIASIGVLTIYVRTSFGNLHQNGHRVNWCFGHIHFPSRQGKGGSPESRVAILHSLAHIESWAIDLSWDIIARFGKGGGRRITY